MRYKVTREGRTLSVHPTRKAASAAAEAALAYGSVEIIDLDPQDPMRFMAKAKPKTKKK